MKWIGITGSWRRYCPELEEDVRKDISAIFNAGNGIVSGGAWGVDYYATDEALKHDPFAKRIKVIIPSNLHNYTEYYNRRVQFGRIPKENKDLLFEQLHKIRMANPDSLIELDATDVYRKTFYARNVVVAESSDEVWGYQVNKSSGTQKTINAAKALGKPVQLKTYTVDEEQAFSLDCR